MIFLLYKIYLYKGDNQSYDADDMQLTNEPHKYLF